MAHGKFEFRGTGLSYLWLCIQTTILTSVGFLTSASLLNAIFAFFISVIAARTLSYTDFGELSVMMATGAFLALGIDFGVNIVLANRISIRPFTKLYGAVMRARILIAGLFMSMAIVVFILAHMLDFTLPGWFWNWMLVLCSIFWLLVFSTEQTRAQGLKMFWLMAIISLSVNMIRLPWTWWTAKLHGNLNMFVIAYTFPPIILGLMLTWQKRNAWLKKDFTRLIKKTLPVIGWAGVTVCLSAVLFRVDLWTVSVMAGLTEAGKFAVAFQMASLVFIIGSSISSVLLPEITRLDRDNHTHKFLIYYLKWALPLTVISISLAFGLANYTPWIFGEKYKGIEMTTFFLTTSFILSVLNSPFYLLQQSRRRYSFLAKIHTVQTIVLFLGCIMLIPHFGGQGAALANLSMRVLSITFFVFISLYKSSSFPPASESIGKSIGVDV